MGRKVGTTSSSIFRVYRIKGENIYKKQNIILAEGEESWLVQERAVFI